MKRALAWLRLRWMRLRKARPARPPAPPIDPRVRRAVWISMAVLAASFGMLTGLLLIDSVSLPQVELLEQYRPMSTTVLYDVHGNTIGSFALERRVIVGYDDFSPLLRQAVLSIEDKNFDSHWGVNLVRVAGAAWRDLTASGRAQGASTLTMQLSRNLFLSNERTFARKLQEVIFSIQVEHHFTKPQIFTLYGNQIYLGHGMYGFEAASEYFFNKRARDLTLSEAALLAGLPKSPTNYSPLSSPERAMQRRNLVLAEMAHDGLITQAQADAAQDSPLGLHLQPPVNSEAPWFVEEIRRSLEKQFGPDQVHEGGLKVYTTMDLELQRSATRAVLDGLAKYERAHGWKGHLINVIASGGDVNMYRHPDWGLPATPGEYVHGMVTFVQPGEVSVRIGDRAATIRPDGWKWTGEAAADKFLHQGDIVYVHIPDTPQSGEHWEVQLEQDSGAQGALLAMDNSSGDVLAMVGGRDFSTSQFNRATQAARETGSSFKPFVYAAAVEHGAKPDDRIDDSPVTFETVGGAYSPHNFDNEYRGSMSLLSAFADSRNIPALKLAQRVGIRNVIAMAHRCGITANIPPFLPVALGAADVTLLEQVGAFSTFPNGGVRIPPRFVRRVTTAGGRTLSETRPAPAQAMEEKTAHTMLTFLQAVIQQGTGAAARSLNHPLGGKSGTTNDFTDAWFVGFSPSVTMGVWTGFDNHQSLGEKATGANVALPIWMDFMRAADARHPGEQFDMGKPTPKDAAKATVPKPVSPADSTVHAAATPPVAPKPAPTETKPAEAVPAKSESKPEAAAASQTPAIRLHMAAQQ